MATTRISDLHPGRTDWRITAKVLSTWFVHDFFSKRVMLLVDEKGNTIEATIIHTPLMKKTPQYIYDGEWYSISNFMVIKPTLKDRNTTNPYQIKTWNDTEMIILGDVSPSHFFRFKDFDDMKNGRSIDGSSFDVFGCIVAVKQRRIHGSISAEDGIADDYDEVVFTLLNGRNETFKCCAKRDYASNFMHQWRQNGYHLTYKTHPVFCVLRFWKLGVSEGAPCIVNCSGSSRLFLQPNIEGLENHKAK
ncbi:PREDICTED: uncharacterized protein LOC104748598 [Camelina sativa]|uniref:Uncharacterized protein LOC104748598 n=1 Tax=Camelina sativa TaxID=90675 RepID=A0ABM0WBA3_CAMSA|nr:PREDICTED: uncharacterized protein LOC104748598 [Camelina sativa]